MHFSQITKGSWALERHINMTYTPKYLARLMNSQDDQLDTDFKAIITDDQESLYDFGAKSRENAEVAFEFLENQAASMDIEVQTLRYYSVEDRHKYFQLRRSMENIDTPDNQPYTTTTTNQPTQPQMQPISFFDLMRMVGMVPYQSNDPDQIVIRIGDQVQITRRFSLKESHQVLEDVMTHLGAKNLAFLDMDHTGSQPQYKDYQDLVSCFSQLSENIDVAQAAIIHKDIAHRKMECDRVRATVVSLILKYIEDGHKVNGGYIRALERRIDELTGYEVVCNLVGELT